MEEAIILKHPLLHLSWLFHRNTKKSTIPIILHDFQDLHAILPPLNLCRHLPKTLTILALFQKGGGFAGYCVSALSYWAQLFYYFSRTQVVSRANCGFRTRCISTAKRPGLWHDMQHRGRCQSDIRLAWQKIRNNTVDRKRAALSICLHYLATRLKKWVHLGHYFVRFLEVCSLRCCVNASNI